MRFRATISDVTTFVQVVQLISKLAKKCVIKFSEQKMHLICHDETEGGVQVWSQVNQESLFGSYRIESNQGNEIHLSTSIAALLTVLKSAAAQEGKGEIVVKLAKRPQGGAAGLAEGGAGAVLKPCLVWEIGGDSRFGREPRLSHELQIKVLKAQDIALLTEPLCPEPDIHIMLPALNSVRTVTEHLSRIAKNVKISANASGDLHFAHGGDSSGELEVKTEWKGLHVPTIESRESASSQSEATQRSPDHFFSTTVSIKSLLRFLTAHSVQGQTIACLIEGHALIMYLYIGDPEAAGGVLTFFIPTCGNGDDF